MFQKFLMTYMERDASHAFEDTIKLRAIRDESQAIIKSIESF